MSELTYSSSWRMSWLAHSPLALALWDSLNDIWVTPGAGTDLVMYDSV